MGGIRVRFPTGPLKMMEIRNGRISDSKELTKMLNSIPEFQGYENEDFYSLKRVGAMISNKKRNFIILAKENKKIAGFLTAEIYPGENFSFLCELFVKPEFRRKGLALRLIKEYEKYCKKMRYMDVMAFVKPRNTAMIRLCRKTGFKEGKLFRYYRKKLK